MSKNDDQDDIRKEFDDSVNMSPSELEKWLETDDSKSVGQGSGESKGHKSGRRIVEIKRTNKDDLTDSDYDHMEKVNSYVARHLKQKPDKSGKELEESDWAMSLKNWGHDPTK